MRTVVYKSFGFKGFMYDRAEDKKQFLQYSEWKHKNKNMKTFKDSEEKEALKMIKLLKRKTKIENNIREKKD